MFSDSDVPATVPVYEHTAEGVRLKRHTSYFVNAQRFAELHRSDGVIGFIVRNRFGTRLPMTYIVFERMQDKFASGELEVVDYYRRHDLGTNAIFNGFDTESMESFTGKI